MAMLEEMATFVRIVDTGSISRAARTLRLSVGMASRQLKALEEELGVQLLRRTTRKLDLTPAGEAFLTRARGVLRDLEDAKQAARAGHNAMGNVVLSVPVCLGPSIIVPLMPRLLEKHPRLRFDLRFEDRAVSLLEDGIDIAIRSEIQMPPSHFVVARRMVEYERVLCATPALLKAHPKLEEIEDLTRVPCIPYATTTWHFDRPSGRERVTVDGPVHVDSILGTLTAARAGLGVAWLPTWIAAEEFRRKRLARVLPEAKMPAMKVFAYTHKQALGGRGAVGTVLDYFIEGIPRETERRYR